MSVLTEPDIAWFMRGYTSALRHQWITPNTMLYPWESDLLSVTYEGHACEFEIKCSRADLKQDMQKPKHRDGLLRNGHYPLPDALEQGPMLLACKRPNYFSYAMPCKLYRMHPQVALPPFAGVYTVDDQGRVREERAPHLLHPKRIGNKDLMLLARRIHHRYWNELRRARHAPESWALEKAGFFRD